MSESGWQIPSVMAKGVGRGNRGETFGFGRERRRFHGRESGPALGGGRRRRVRRGLEIDLGGLGFTFPFLNDMLQEVKEHPEEKTNNRSHSQEDGGADGLLSCYKDRPSCLANDLTAEVRYCLTSKLSLKEPPPNRQVDRLVKSIREVTSFVQSWTNLADQLANALMEEEEIQL